MSKMYDVYKHEFEKSNLYDREQISWKEYNALENKEDILQDYDNSNVLINYRLIPTEVSDEERNNYIQMSLLDSIRMLNNKINTMKNIMIFWVVLTVIGIIGVIYSAQQH